LRRRRGIALFRWRIKNVAVDVDGSALRMRRQGKQSKRQAENHKPHHLHPPFRCCGLWIRPLHAEGSDEKIFRKRVELLRKYEVNFSILS